jgi:hypothetical protein
MISISDFSVSEIDRTNVAFSKQILNPAKGG